MTVRTYIQFLVDNRILNAELALPWCEWYENIRFSDQELQLQEFKDFIKLYTALIKSLPQ